jgi:hypothetical protein
MTTVTAEPTAGAARPPSRRQDATASNPTPSWPDPPSPANSGTPDTKRPNADPGDRRRHWHPAVPGVRAAVPAARRLAGGGRC